MEKSIGINSFLKQIKKKGVIGWTDKLTFPRILVLWVSIVIFFGLIYFFLQRDGSFLFYNISKQNVADIRDAIYFSFVTATTTGFGDIVPFGFFKLVAIFEVVFGLILLAVVTSKLVSIKQDIILSEVYEISLNERVNRLRSSLLLFRQNLDRVIIKVEDSSIQKREINNIYTHISYLEDILSEVISFVAKPGTYQFIKNVDPVSAVLIFNSTLSSFEKLSELITLMNQKKIEWKTEINLLILNKCMHINDNLFNQVNSSKVLTRETINDLIARKNKVKNTTEAELSVKQDLPK